MSSLTAHASLNCGSNATLCSEVYDSEAVFGQGHYIGHDEPSVLFYSGQPGSGNRARYQLTLPREGSGSKARYNFQLHPAFWFGMAMCDTQSYPEQVHKCTPDSDSNIVDPAKSAKHAGTAFMEMQFYPPGWAPFQLPGGVSCSAQQWCAALNIDSLSQDPVNGKQINDKCLATIGSPEYVNFAFITHSGTPQAPPNPVQATGATYTPDPTRDLMMNGGDNITVTMHDTGAGLRIDIVDQTTGQSGFMVASAKNGFGQVLYAPNPSTKCVDLPYDFHPMYSTSSPQTRVPWAAHTYNIAYSDEIGHFDFCSKVASGGCSGTEGRGTNAEPNDGDDFSCLPASAAFLYKVSGCAAANVPGFDGTSYLADWPDGSSSLPSPVKFTSPLTGSKYSLNYGQSAFETDLPRVEQGIAGCNPFKATGCTLLPTTDDGTPANFYPFYSTTYGSGGGCTWAEGNYIPGVTVNDFGRNAQYGTYDTGVYYTGSGGVPFAKADDFRQIFFNNLCPAS